MRERSVERRSRNWALARGWWEKKFKSPGQRSVPDRVFAKKGCGVVWVEFKRPSKKPTKLQNLEHNRMCQAGLHVASIDNFDTFKALLLLLENDYLR